MKKNEVKAVTEKMVNGVRIMNAKDTLNSVSAFLDMGVLEFADICEKDVNELTPIDKLSLYATKVDFVGRLDNKTSFSRAIAMYNIVKQELYTYSKKDDKAYTKYFDFFKDKFHLAKSTVSEILRTCDVFASKNEQGEYYFSALYEAFNFTVLLKLSADKEHALEIKELIADGTIKPSMSSKDALKAVADATAIVVDGKEAEGAKEVDKPNTADTADKSDTAGKPNTADTADKPDTADKAEKLIAVSFTRAEWERITKQLDITTNTREYAERINAILKASNK